MLEDVDVHVGLKTLFASTCAGLFRIALMPIDALKTSLQVDGKQGLHNLRVKMQAAGPKVLFAGSMASAGATLMGHYPWFATFNYLTATLPRPAKDNENYRLLSLSRNALSGFTASIVSDTVSNSVRVIKTTKQTHAEPITYRQALVEVLQKDGVPGLLGRGLATRLATNGAQGIMFAVVWKYLEETLFSNK